MLGDGVPNSNGHNQGSLTFVSDRLSYAYRRTVHYFGRAVDVLKGTNGVHYIARGIIGAGRIGSTQWETSLPGRTFYLFDELVDASRIASDAQEAALLLDAKHRENNEKCPSLFCSIAESVSGLVGDSASIASLADHYGFVDLALQAKRIGSVSIFGYRPLAFVQKLAIERVSIITTAVSYTFEALGALKFLGFLLVVKCNSGSYAGQSITWGQVANQVVRVFTAVSEVLFRSVQVMQPTWVAQPMLFTGICQLTIGFLGVVSTWCGPVFPAELKGG